MFKFKAGSKFKRTANSNAKPKSRNAIAQFMRAEDGTLIIFSIFLLIMMLMVAGMSVDLMRNETQRARLQSTLDRAVLAGASLDQSLDSEAVVRDYFDKAGLGDYLTGVTVVDGIGARSVSATANAKTQTFFMKLLGFNTLPALAAGQAEESLTEIEISLILDISGSMGWYSAVSGQKKIVDLIAAAKEFVFLMQCNPDATSTSGSPSCTIAPNSVSISLVPYAEQVLVGENLIQQFNVTNEHTSSSCADFAQADFSATAISLSDPLLRAGTIDARTNYRYWQFSSRFAGNRSRTCRTGAYREITPFSNSYVALQAQIDLLQASGYTSIDVGMKWGTALLDPAFRPVVSNLSSGATPIIAAEFDGRPFDYGISGVQKVVVLMTDGVNTSQYVLKAAYRSGPAPIWYNPNDNDNLSVYRASTNKYYYVHNNSWNSQPYGGIDAVQMTYPQFWEIYNVDFFQEVFWWLPNPVDVYDNAPKNTRLDAICTAAKAQGIEVFTIGFETSAASSAVMKSCATSNAHNFDVDGLDIDNAFAAIARKLHQLRLTN